MERLVLGFGRNRPKRSLLPGACPDDLRGHRRRERFEDLPDLVRAHLPHHADDVLDRELLRQSGDALGVHLRPNRGRPLHVGRDGRAIRSAPRAEGDLSPTGAFPPGFAVAAGIGEAGVWIEAARLRASLSCAWSALIWSSRPASCLRTSSSCRSRAWISRFFSRIVCCCATNVSGRPNCSTYGETRSIVGLSGPSKMILCEGGQTSAPASAPSAATFRTKTPILNFRLGLRVAMFTGAYLRAPLNRARDGAR